jgi:hypothetical protein
MEKDGTMNILLMAMPDAAKRTVAQSRDTFGDDKFDVTSGLELLQLGWDQMNNAT